MTPQTKMLHAIWKAGMPNPMISPAISHAARKDHDAVRYEYGNGSVSLLLQPHIERVGQDVLGVFFIDAELAGVFVFVDQPLKVRPEKVDQWAVWIFLMVRLLMMEAMPGNPASRCFLSVAQ